MYSYFTIKESNVPLEKLKSTINRHYAKYSKYGTQKTFKNMSFPKNPQYFTQLLRLRLNGS